MVLCELPYVGDNFFATWMILNVLALISLLGLSGSVFYYYYWPSQVTYEKWTRKLNPKFPSPEKVRDEVLQMLKGMFTATLCPAASLYLAKRGIGHAYCGISEEQPLSAQIGQFFLIWFATDLWSFCYHRLGHQFKTMWNFHRHHHVFYNPSPFAVIADEYFDQFWRSAPMLVLPLLTPINMDILFGQNAVFFYTYGVFLHWGYEVDFISAHNPIMNSSYHHYCHHSKAILGKPYHCGFYFKLWDQLTGGMYPEDKCFCTICERASGKRTKEQFKQIQVPDYSVLFDVNFWLKGSSEASEAQTAEEKAFEAAGAGKDIKVQ